jgi:hypothetical protein
VPGTPVYLEIGKKRTFAGALEWPGWCRSARDEDGALKALLDYAPRYAAAVTDFKAPRSLDVVERLAGDAGTDFGVPGVAPSRDSEPVRGAELARKLRALQECWGAFDEAARKHSRKKLTTGPRGGGRQVNAMSDHVREGDKAYFNRLGGSTKGLRDELGPVHDAMLELLEHRAKGGEPPPNPRRRAALWTVRYTIRRSAWHALDHAWEIEDRAR